MRYLRDRRNVLNFERQRARAFAENGLRVRTKQRDNAGPDQGIVVRGFDAESFKGLVAEGRDCGSVVFPYAEVKIYLTASAQDRAARRAKDEGKSVDETISQQKIRDQQDSSRKAAPLQIPADSLVIDSSQMSFEAVVKKVEDHVRKILKL